MRKGKGLPVIVVNKNGQCERVDSESLGWFFYYYAPALTIQL